MGAEGGEKQLQRLAFEQDLPRHVVDHQMREIRLARHRAEGRELRAGEAHEIGRAGVRVGDGLQHRLLGRGRDPAFLAELGELLVAGVGHAFSCDASGQ